MLAFHGILLASEVFSKYIYCFRMESQYGTYHLASLFRLIPPEQNKSMPCFI